VTSQIFPDMPLPAGNGLAPGGTSGVIPGLETAIAAILRNYNPGDIGICEVMDKLQLSLSVPYWAEYPWYNIERTAAVAGGFGGAITVYTVPMDRRYLVQAITAERVSGGDGSLTYIQLVPPGENVSAGAGTVVRLAQVEGNDNNMSWPNKAGVTTVAEIFHVPSPLLLEPGTLIQIRTAGTGVSATEWDTEVVGVMIPITRAMAP